MLGYTMCKKTWISRLGADMFNKPKWERSINPQNNTKPNIAHHLWWWTVTPLCDWDRNEPCTTTKLPVQFLRTTWNRVFSYMSLELIYSGYSLCTTKGLMNIAEAWGPSSCHWVIFLILGGCWQKDRSDFWIASALSMFQASVMGAQTVGFLKLCIASLSMNLTEQCSNYQALGCSF